MSAHILPLDFIAEDHSEAPDLNVAASASFDDLESQGLRPARGIAYGILFSIPAWLAFGTLVYVAW